MKAAQISEYGGPSVLQINEIDTPAASEGQVLVEVHAASLNPFDSTVRNGYVKQMIKNLPATLGGDIAGVITELGEGVEGFAVGDKVYGQAAVVAGNSGAFAEFAATKASQIAKMPENMDFNEAASLPLVGTSALQALTEHINLQAGQKIFIHGGAGGIGTIAIQVAKDIGAHITTTATADGIELVKNLGADEVIDYKSQDFSEILKDYDAVFDTVGGDDFNKTFGILKKGGIAVSMIAQPDEAKASELGITAMMQGTKVNTAVLDKLRGLVESGKVLPQVGKVFKFEQITQAFTERENGSISGKVVIEIKKP